MLFNSLEFLVFLPVVLAIYYLLPHRGQNPFLVLASCWFYASWDPLFLLPLLTSTTIDYVCAEGMQRSFNRGEPSQARKKFLIFSLVTNLGLLAFFKYCNFFVDSFHALFLGFGIALNKPTLDVVLPIGISFYTFQALSYTIDVYRGQQHAVRSFWDFFLAVLFFPHLVAGPIQRASNLIAQVVHPRRTTAVQVQDGLALIAWGYFKKIYIADGLAPIVDQVFSSASPGGGQVAVGVLAFAIQIYCDFSGYTDIARGVAKLMGFEFMLNFNLPYFALNPPDFWRRWHISLSSWLREYLYIPLGGNRGGPLRMHRNLIITMVLGGLWHGAAWNFVLWGFYHGAILVGHRLATPALARIGVQMAGVWRLPWLLTRMAAMFLMTCYGWLLFRADSFGQIVYMTAALFSPFEALPLNQLGEVAWRAAPLIVVQVIQYRSGRLEFLRLPVFTPALRSAACALMAYAVLFLGGASQSFVYFQF